MKKYIFLLIALVVTCLPSKVNAQAVVTTDPVMWTFDQPVTWYFDLTGDPGIVAGESLHLWTWSPAKADGKVADLTYVSGMTWKLTLTPTDFYGWTVQQLTDHTDEFWMNMQDDNGVQVVSTIHVVRAIDDFNAFASSHTPTQVFPTTFTVGKRLSILVNINKVLTANGVGGLANASAIYFNSGLNDFDSTATNVKVNFNDPASLSKTQFSKVNDSIYRFEMTPSAFYNIPDNYPMKDIAFTILGPDGTLIGTAIGGANFSFSAIPVVPKTPALYIFPTEFTQNDILVLDRENNESSVSRLSYVLTAGTVTLKGDFSGTGSSLKAYIDLLTQLAGQQGISSIHLLITDNNGRVLLDSDIPLVPLSKLD